jgi:hypothetical protein
MFNQKVIQMAGERGAAFVAVDTRVSDDTFSQGSQVNTKKITDRIAQHVRRIRVSNDVGACGHRCLRRPPTSLSSAKAWIPRTALSDRRARVALYVSHVQSVQSLRSWLRRLRRSAGTRCRCVRWWRRGAAVCTLVALTCILCACAGCDQVAVGLVNASNECTSEDTKDGDEPHPQGLVFAWRRDTADAVSAAARSLWAACGPIEPVSATSQPADAPTPTATQ